MGVPLLLGTDFLEAAGGVIDYNVNEVILKGRRYPFVVRATMMRGIAEVMTPSDLDRVLTENQDVFYNEKLGLTESVGLAPMTIETEGPPVYQRPYRAALTKRQVIDDAIDEMLADGVIEPSTSPWASPVTLTPKKDG